MEGTYTLVGMLDSPFVRRVAIVLRRYGFCFENLPLMTVGNATEFAAYSPLKRAPTLILPSGHVLFDSQLIVDHLDEMVTPGQSLLPTSSDERLLCRAMLGIIAGIADKSVSGVYEHVFHTPEQRSARLLERIKGQICDSLSWLEERAPSDAFLFGEHLSHADVLLGTALCFAREAHPHLFQLSTYPLVASWYERVTALPDFVETYLPLEPPQ